MLSQWRGYSDDGVGYAIGFSTKALSSIGEGDPVRCIYDPDEQKKIINELVDDVLSTRDIKNRTGLLVGGFMIAMTQCATFFKDPSFKEENEWRLVVGPKPYTDENFRFRAGKSMLIPYFVLKMANRSWENKIEEVVVGPCPHPEISVMAVGGLLMRNWGRPESGTRARVRLSSVPYRSW